MLIQAALLVPAVLRSGLRLRFVWRPHDPAIREILSLSSWTFGFVFANQMALFVVLAIAVHLGASRVTDYTYAFQFFQLPFGIIAVSVMSTVIPELAYRYSLNDLGEMAHQFGLGLRRMMVGILPATAGYLLLAGPLIALLLHHGAFRSGSSTLTGQLLALLAVGLPGYCVYLLCISALQSMRDTRTAFFLYLLENSLNVVLAFLLTPAIGARGLSLSLSGAYTISAVVALFVVRRRMGGIDGRNVRRYVARSLVLSLAMALVVALVTTAIGSAAGLGLVVRVVAGVLSGILAYGARRITRRDALGLANSQAGGRRLPKGGCMAPIRVVTDSAADLGQAVADKIRYRRGAARRPARRHRAGGDENVVTRGILAAVRQQLGLSGDLGSLAGRFQRRLLGRSGRRGHRSRLRDALVEALGHLSGRCRRRRGRG